MIQPKAFLHNLKHSRILFERPGVLPRVASNIISRTVFGKPRLRIVEFVVNTECNSNCEMCYATKYEKPGMEKITPAGIRKIWGEAKRMGAFIAAIEGGEALLHPRFYDVLAAVEPFSNIVVLVSNSINLNKDIIKDLKKSGLSVLHLSLDSADPEKNDKIRGCPGHFEKVMNGIEYAKEVGLEVYFSSVLRHGNKDEYLSLIKLAEEMDIGVSGALLVSMGRYTSEEDQRLTPEDYEWLLGILKDKGHILRFDWCNNASNRYECPAGNEKVSVSVYGEVMACVCNHLSFGNALEEPLERIVKRMREFRFFKERRPQCLAALDEEYLTEYLDPIANSESYPVSIFDHPKNPDRSRTNAKSVK